jgi:hypothetical protein
MKRFVAFTAAALLFAGCFEKGSNPTSSGLPGGESSNIKMTDIAYTNTASSITTISVSTSCDSTTLVTSRDTSTSTYTVTATTLTMIDSTDTTTLTRVGTGSGLQGTWLVANATDLTGCYMVVTAANIAVWAPKALMMTMIRVGFLGAFAQAQGITVDTSSAEVTRLTGTTTHEVVTLSLNAQGDLVWSSSVAAHATTTMALLNVTTCPQDEPPVWLGDFMMANQGTAKALRKISVSSAALVKQLLN